MMTGGKSSEKTERARLDAARVLISDGKMAEARRLLDELRSTLTNGSTATLGPWTALGMPRKLHSAYLKLAKAQGDAISRIGLQYNLVPRPGTLEKHFRCDDDMLQRMARLNAMPVPRVIHQIWIGSKPVPPTVAAWETHAKANGYEYRLWREDEIREIGVFENEAFKVFLEQGDYPGAVDIARYLILHEQGGIYLDCDWYPARNNVSFDAFLPLVGLSALAEMTPRNLGGDSLLLTNSFIASPPGNPLFTCLVDALPGMMADLPGAPAWWVTGPVVFTLLSRKAAVTVPDTAFVAANLPVNAPIDDVLAAATRAEAISSGFLIGWKCW